MKHRSEKILAFLKEIEKYKLIERNNILSDLKRKESDAEHSWHMAMFLMLFEKDLPQNLDKEKMLKLALMHDLVEIYAGDTFAFGTAGKTDKKEREKKAAKKLFSQLPEDLEKDLNNLFEEYEAAETKESKIVKSLDKIQPILQNLSSDGWSWKTNNISFKQVDDYKRKHMQHDPFILEIYEKLMKEAKDKGLLQ